MRVYQTKHLSSCWFGGVFLKPFFVRQILLCTFCEKNCGLTNWFHSSLFASVRVCTSWIRSGLQKINRIIPYSEEARMFKDIEALLMDKAIFFKHIRYNQGKSPSLRWRGNGKFTKWIKYLIKLPPCLPFPVLEHRNGPFVQYNKFYLPSLIELYWWNVQDLALLICSNLDTIMFVVLKMFFSSLEKAPVASCFVLVVRQIMWGTSKLGVPSQNWRKRQNPPHYSPFII